MKIHLRYQAILKIQGIANNSEVELPDGTSIAALLASSRIKEEQQRYILCYVNGERKTPDTVLRDGDSLQLLIPVGGG